MRIRFANPESELAKATKDRVQSIRVDVEVDGAAAPSLTFSTADIAGGLDLGEIDPGADVRATVTYTDHKGRSTSKTYAREDTTAPDEPGEAVLEG